MISELQASPSRLDSLKEQKEACIPVQSTMLLLDPKWWNPQTRPHLINVFSSNTGLCLCSVTQRMDSSHTADPLADQGARGQRKRVQYAEQSTRSFPTFWLALYLTLVSEMQEQKVSVSNLWASASASRQLIAVETCQTPSLMLAMGSQRLRPATVRLHHRDRTTQHTREHTSHGSSHFYNCI